MLEYINQLPWWGILLLVVLWVVKIYMAIHAFQRRRIFWGILILFFELSAIFYFIMYMRPEILQQREMANKDVGPKVNKTTPAQEIETLKLKLENADTVANRQYLAHAYMKNKDFALAVKYYQASLVSFYKDDVSMNMDLARAYFFNQEYDKAKEQLRLIKEIDPSFKSDEHPYMLALTLEKLNEKSEAVAVYESFTKHFPGEEPRFRYGLLLKELGSNDKSLEIFNDIIERTHEYPLQYKKVNHKWIEAARKMITDADLEKKHA